MRVIVQHPETVGSGPQLFQTFTVHRSPVTKIMLSEKHLVSGTGHPPSPVTPGIACLFIDREEVEWFMLHSEKLRECGFDLAWMCCT